MIPYEHPRNWTKYSREAIADRLTEAKAAILSLKSIPYQKEWVEALQRIELKREVAGTSRIEGAEFTEKELEAALKETPEQLVTRSQRQAHAAMKTYKWIAGLPKDRPIDEGLIKEIHRHIITGADDDHCPPGRLRERGQNVNFGRPRHRGAEGGEQCASAFSRLCVAIQREFRDHDGIVQALMAHYHFASMHPFEDGNGRTARVLEALMLGREGLRDTCFVAMSNYYYDEKNAYLAALSETRALGHDLTPFLNFSLHGVAVQSKRLLSEIQKQIERALFRNMMFDLFQRLRTPKKRVLAKRQIEILKTLLTLEEIEWRQLVDSAISRYGAMKNPVKALVRDVNGLIMLGALNYRMDEDKRYLSANLKWPTQITETDFFKRIKEMPKSKSHAFLG
ncbi:Fic family protein [Elusimicrobiota bacterium]